ncbi:MAG: hypothetical protein JWN71_336 [Xanthobacteraceae bacterium]|nr:hypothetical protein [Xanthobacteraceae bacterium]
MALKDLVAKKSEIAESAIESVVAKYVRYYTDTSEIGFTPDGAALSGENKILVYLVAILGWQYVTGDTPEISTKPADLEKSLGIAGGTLRPLLKSLKDAHMIAPSADGYRVREGNLEAIAAQISGGKKPTRRKITTSLSPASKAKSPSRTARRSTSNPISSSIDAWITDGFFRTPRTLHAVHQRLHEHGVIARQTSVSKPLLKAVQSRRLMRQKAMQDGREVWTYCLTGA